MDAVAEALVRSIPWPHEDKTIAVGAVPVIVVRGADGRIGVLVDACAHRGTRLVEGPAPL